MAELILGPEGSLLRRRHGFDEINPSYDDVSRRAVAFLFDTVELDPALTLRDVFELARHNPALYPVFARFGLETLTREALKDSLSDAEHRDGEGIVYLKLSRAFSSWRGGTRHEAWPLLSFHGMGVAEKIARTQAEGGSPNAPAGAEALIPYSLCGCSPVSFRACVLRYDEAESTWTPPFEDDERTGKGPRKGKARRKSAQRRVSLEMPPPLLGEVIQSVVFEFSWFGVGEQREQGVAALVERINQAELEPFDLNALKAEGESVEGAARGLTHDKVCRDGWV